MKNNYVLSRDNCKTIVSWNLEVKGKKDMDSQFAERGTKRYCSGRLRLEFI